MVFAKFCRKTFPRPHFFNLASGVDWIIAETPSALIVTRNLFRSTWGRHVSRFAIQLDFTSKASAQWRVLPIWGVDQVWAGDGHAFRGFVGGQGHIFVFIPLPEDFVFRGVDSAREIRGGDVLIGSLTKNEKGRKDFF